ncbi:MAG TPA: DegT/DnrJ/EryC1/StrS family aminotransferase, partial [Rhodanobacteraceae bacterium]|nr:DegT/DnrJ/EryC1/StrS family aminotransferase [Rhodanobacteraceae bacterium]
NAHMFYLLLPDLATRTRFINGMREHDIHPVFHYIPLHSAPSGRRSGRTAGELAVTDDISERLVRLPFWLGLEEHLPAILEIADAAIR